MISVDDEVRGQPQYRPRDLVDDGRLDSVFPRWILRLDPNPKVLDTKLQLTCFWGREFLPEVRVRDVPVLLSIRSSYNDVSSDIAQTI